VAPRLLYRFVQVVLGFPQHYDTFTYLQFSDYTVIIVKATRRITVIRTKLLSRFPYFTRLMFNFLREIFASQKVNGQERNFECIILHLDLTVFVFVTTTDTPEG